MKHDIKQAEKVKANVDVVNAEDDQPAALYKLDEVPIYAILQPGQGNALEGKRRSCLGNCFRNLIGARVRTRVLLETYVGTVAFEMRMLR